MNRAGTVLVFALLAVLAMELLALGAFGFARIARLGALHEQEHATLQAAADDALVQAIASMDARDILDRPVGAQWTVPIATSPARVTHAAATMERLSARLLLLDVEVGTRGLSARRRALLRVIPAEDVLSAFPAMITTALPADASLPAEAVDTAQCGEGTDLPETLPAWAPLALADTLPLGEAVGLGWSDVEAMAGSAPLATAGPPAFAVAGRDTTIDGDFQGLLVARGDVHLAPGARLRGLVSARGELIAASGARVEGAIRALALRDEGADFGYDRCAVAAALDASPLRQVYRSGPRWQLPAFD